VQTDLTGRCFGKMSRIVSVVSRPWISIGQLPETTETILLSRDIRLKQSPARNERDLREMVAEYRVRHGFNVRTALDGEAIAARPQEKSANLVILDINMPGEDGMTLAPRLREHSDVCIMMLTAAREIVDRLVGLEHLSQRLAVGEINGFRPAGRVSKFLFHRQPRKAWLDPAKRINIGARCGHRSSNL